MRSLICGLTFLQCIYLQAQQPKKIVVRKDSAGTLISYNESRSSLPGFIGGTDELNKFIAAHIRFPERIKFDSSFYSCKVYVKFIVETNGTVSNPQIIKGCQGFDECDKEALRVISIMPPWKPAIQNGKTVKRTYSLPINFKRT